MNNCLIERSISYHNHTISQPARCFCFQARHIFVAIARDTVVDYEKLGLSVMSWIEQFLQGVPTSIDNNAWLRIIV